MSQRLRPPRREARCAHGKAAAGIEEAWRGPGPASVPCFVTAACGRNPDLALLGNHSREQSEDHAPSAKGCGGDAEGLQPRSTKVRRPSHPDKTVLPTQSPVTRSSGGALGPRPLPRRNYSRARIKDFGGLIWKGGELAGVSTAPLPRQGAWPCPRPSPQSPSRCSGV